MPDIPRELERLHETLADARTPEDVFGVLQGLGAAERIEAVDRAFRMLARLAHPDAYQVKGAEAVRLATQAFQSLTDWHGKAKERIATGTYGSGTPHVPKKTGAFTVRSRTRVYTLEAMIAEGDITDLWHARYTDGKDQAQAVVKIARDSVDNDLVANESEVLMYLFDDASACGANFQRYLPKLIESFRIASPTHDMRQANVLQYLDGYYTFEQVRKAYPKGLDPRDAAWMFNRLLEILSYAQRRNVVHGAVLPPHCLVKPEDHALALVDWSYAIIEPTGGNDHIKAVSLEWESFYPKEVLAKKPPGTATDIFMAAKCAAYLLVGDSGLIPSCVPGDLETFLKKCLAADARTRPQDMWSLKEAYDGLLVRLYGPKRFRPFSMPDTNQ